MAFRDERIPPKKPKAGRPKAKFDLPEGWEEQILDDYKLGASDAEVKALIYSMRKDGFSNNLWERWMEEEAEFGETIKKGRMLSEAWWLKNGRHNLLTTGFQTGLWSMNMKNRFGWKDKTELSGDAEKPFTIKLIRNDV